MLSKDSKAPQEKQKQDQIPQQNQLKVAEFSLEVQQVKDLKEEGLIGSGITLVALKNKDSFLIASDGTGLKLIQNSTQIYSGKLPQDCWQLNGLAYLSSINAYVLASGNSLFRKDIDG